jgi:hypothetical protein
LVTIDVDVHRVFDGDLYHNTMTRVGTSATLWHCGCSSFDC